MDGDFLRTFTFFFRNLNADPRTLIETLALNPMNVTLPGYTLRVLSYGVSGSDLLCVGEFLSTRKADAVPLTKPILDLYMYAFHQSMTEKGLDGYCRTIEVFSFDTVTEKAYRHYTPHQLVPPTPAPSPIVIQAFDPDAF